MAHEHYVERVERSDAGAGTGMVVGILMVVLVALIALFFIFGGPGRFTAPAGQTNVNVPAQTQPNSGPNVEVPRNIDINVNPGGQSGNPSGGQSGSQPGNQPGQTQPSGSGNR